MTFTHATFVLGTIVHISNISAFQAEHFRLQSCLYTQTHFGPIHVLRQPIYDTVNTWFVVVAVCIFIIINDVDIVFVFSLSFLLSL